MRVHCANMPAMRPSNFLLEVMHVRLFFQDDGLQLCVAAD
jgi:hypothetical protein